MDSVDPMESGNSLLPLEPVPMPVLSAWRFGGGRLRAWCPICECFHLHKAEPDRRDPENPDDPGIWRSGCTEPSSPHYGHDTPYTLCITDAPLPKATGAVRLCRHCGAARYNHLVYPFACPECGHVVKSRPGLSREDIEAGVRNQAHWAELCSYEPRLLDYLRACQAVRDDGLSESFCANEVWYGYHDYRDHGLKAVVEELVGWERAGHPVLGTEKAYDVAYEVGYCVLPPCRDCACW